MKAEVKGTTRPIPEVQPSNENNNQSGGRGLGGMVGNILDQ